MIENLNVEELNRAKRAVDRANERAGNTIRFMIAVDILPSALVYEVRMGENATWTNKTLYRGESFEAFMAVVLTCDKIALADSLAKKMNRLEDKAAKLKAKGLTLTDAELAEFQRLADERMRVLTPASAVALIARDMGLNVPTNQPHPGLRSREPHRMTNRPGSYRARSPHPYRRMT